MMITSKGNTKIKWVRRIQSSRRFRQKERLFIVEGNRWIRELAQLEYWPASLFATESWLQEPENQSLIKNFPVTPLTVSDQIMDHASSLESAPGILAVPPMPSISLPEAPAFILILDRIANPGNLGSLLRSAAAAGVDGVLLTPGCADPFNPKALRGGMGVQIRLPIENLEWADIRHLTDSLAVFIASSRGGRTFYSVDWRFPSAVIIGSEASGPSEEAQNLAQSEITIPMRSGVESLNAAVAGGIILFEVARQRAELNN
ncbi:MAG: RNA methyltransferase [Anaerolineae bacterium]|nr:MAG: RNA methyltransferase [Anaerolineae bacterium]